MPRATYEDVLNAPRNMVAEIIDGELVLTSRPRPRHALAATQIAARLSAPFNDGEGGPGGWWILGEVEVAFGEDLFVPDVAGWKRERLARLPENNPFETRPDWVCEVISPSTERRDRTSKLRTYAAHGVPHVWLIEPAQRMVEVYRLLETNWLLLGMHLDDVRVRLEPFDAVELPLGRLWPEPIPAEPAVPPPP